MRICLLLISALVFASSDVGANTLKSHFLKSHNRKIKKDVNSLPSNHIDMFKAIYDDLQKIKLSMFTNQNKDGVDIKILKCAAELSRSNEAGALKFWQELQIYLAPYDQAKSIASRVIQRVDLDQKENLLPLIYFVQSMNVPQAYDTLTRKLKESGHFYESHEAFLVAENIKNSCGTEQSVFTSLPPILRNIAGNIVTLKNKWNNGYLYFQSDPANFFTWFSPHKNQNLYEGLPQERKPRGHWEFLMIDDKVQIVNSLTGTPLVDDQTKFLVELVNDEEIRLQVFDSGNKKIVGKYLVGKARLRGSQFTQIDFMDKSSASQDQLRWTSQPVEQRAMPDSIQKC